MERIAHISDSGKYETIPEHLEQVDEYATAFAEPYHGEAQVHILSELHDIGKNTDEFQHRILDDGPKVDHSSAGAYEIYDKDVFLAYAIAGHHGGLPNGGTSADNEEDSTLCARMLRVKNGNVPDYSGWERLVPDDLLSPENMKAEKDCYLELKIPKDKSGKQKAEDVMFSLGFRTRMNFSCLVDADWLGTEYFMRDHVVPIPVYDTIEDMADAVEKMRNEKFAHPKTDIDIIRNEISDACFKASKRKPGFFTLNVSTGGGKTQGSLRFGLNHAKKWGMRRIIVGIPYTHIITQNADDYKNTVGQRNVLEHHGAFDFGEDTLMKRASENWDVPLVVTTNVQFFESLHSSLTSRCRKLHNIANSVIILDEVQALPVGMLKTCIRTLVELVENYSCTVVFSTATQPPLKDLLAEYGQKVSEIIPAPARFKKALKRVTYRKIGAISNEELACRLAQHAQVLCIVNSKKQAQDLYAMLPKYGTYHLSTAMYPAHQREVIKTINERVKAGDICRVIATSVIEAGVDLDFPALYRANTGVDSIIQAAGRCNRNNTRDAKDSIVTIFDTTEDYTIPQEVEQRRAVTNETIKDFSKIDSDANVRRFFKNLYNERDLDSSNVYFDLTNPAQGFGGIPFRDVSKKMHLIDEKTFPVIYPNEITLPIIEKIKAGEVTRDMLRTLEQYTVSLYRNNKNLLSKHLEEIGDDEENPMYVLKDLDLYDENVGLKQR